MPSVHSTPSVRGVAQITKYTDGRLTITWDPPESTETIASRDWVEDMVKFYNAMIEARALIVLARKSIDGVSLVALDDDDS